MKRGWPRKPALHMLSVVVGAIPIDVVGAVVGGFIEVLGNGLPHAVLVKEPIVMAAGLWPIHIEKQTARHYNACTIAKHQTRSNE